MEKHIPDKGEQRRGPEVKKHMPAVVSLSRHDIVMQKDSWVKRQQKFEAKYGGS